jgi:hypothetical protein
MRKKVILLVRAYNDLDCRLPLLFEYANNNNYDLVISGTPVLLF